MATIRRGVTLVLLITAVVAWASSAAQAGPRVVRVDAADVLVAAAWDTTSCDVRVLRKTGDVDLMCADGGAVAIMLRIPLPGARTIDAVRSIHLDDAGSSDNCDDEAPPRATLRHGALRLIVAKSYDDIGSFDCWYHSVRVRYRPHV